MQLGLPCGALARIPPLCCNKWSNAKDNRKSQSDFKCVECGYKNNADHVGALNILERRHRLLACGEHGISQLLEAGTCLVIDHKTPMVLN